MDRDPCTPFLCARDEKQSPTGEFESSMGAGRDEPNRLIVLVYIGAAFSAAGLIALGVGLLQAA